MIAESSSVPARPKAPNPHGRSGTFLTPRNNVTSPLRPPGAQIDAISRIDLTIEFDAGSVRVACAPRKRGIACILYKSQDVNSTDAHEEVRRMTQGVTGSVMVVGGGIAGMQAALDLANSGYYVYLLEKSPSIGGVMSQLDKTFPTNDCAM
jgi:heterodisulfide reductase subunit A